MLNRVRVWLRSAVLRRRVEREMQEAMAEHLQRATSRLMARGLSAEDAVSLIVNGFCKQVFRELPMEFAVEAQKLLGVTLEGAVG